MATPRNQARISWNAVTTNSDGTPITDLAGYRVYYSLDPRISLTVLDVGNVTTVLMDTPAFTHDGRWVFAISAYDTSNNESSLVGVGLKWIIRTGNRIKRRR